MDRFREVMEERWREFEVEGSRLSDGNLVTVLAKAWYRTLDPTERKVADQVLGEWVIQGTLRQAHAIALIEEFRIRSAEPTLQELAAKLDGTPGPEAMYLGKKVQRAIHALKSDDD